MYYTIRVRDIEKQIWDVVKYTHRDTGNTILLITDKGYTFNKSETIKSSLSYIDASNLAATLNKLNG